LYSSEYVIEFNGQLMRLPNPFFGPGMNCRGKVRDETKRQNAEKEWEWHHRFPSSVHIRRILAKLYLPVP